MRRIDGDIRKQYPHGEETDARESVSDLDPFGFASVHRRIDGS